MYIPLTQTDVQTKTFIRATFISSTHAIKKNDVFLFHEHISGERIKVSRVQNDAVSTSTVVMPNFQGFVKVFLSAPNFKRPVAIFGPFSDMINQYLLDEKGHHFKLVQTNHENSIESSSMYRAIKNHTERHPLCIATISTMAQMADHDEFHPICINVKSELRNVEEIRRNSGFADKMHPENQVKFSVTSQYEYLIADNIELDIHTDWKKAVLKAINDQQGRNLWRKEAKRKSDHIDESSIINLVVPVEKNAVKPTLKPRRNDLGLAICESDFGVLVVLVSQTSMFYGQVKPGDLIKSVNELNLEKYPKGYKLS